MPVTNLYLSRILFFLEGYLNFIVEHVATPEHFTKHYFTSHYYSVEAQG